MPVWLRLTGRFGLSGEAPRTGNFLLDALGPIIRADGREIVEGLLPARMRQLIGQLERRDRNVRTRHQTLTRRRTSLPIADTPGITVTPLVRTPHPSVAVSVPDRVDEFPIGNAHRASALARQGSESNQPNALAQVRA
jgi:hypothetical protein